MNATTTTNKARFQATNMDNVQLPVLWLYPSTTLLIRRLDKIVINLQ